ncbi:hypothetical protein EPO04_01150 [Patescibacteria group bacterium]|nr:MAG: hypothetical protein EPO04_01150 [Patescibacteria group bacterium]
MTYLGQNLPEIGFGGNTTGTMDFANAGLSLYGGNNVTLSGSRTNVEGYYSYHSITISAANQTVQTQNRFNLTLSGNTAGAMAQVSSGSLTLAGGNNITLSQNGNAVTISGAAGGGAAFSAGMSNLGNTSGDTGLATNKLVLLGNNNITLSQVTNATGNLLGVSGPNMFAGGMSNLGNTSGTSGTVSNQMVLAGGNNVTLSQSTGAGGNTISVSAANQTVQTQNLQNVTLSGNTAGVMANVSSGTLTLAGGNNITLSQNGNAVTVSGAAGGGVAFSAGISNIGNTSGTSGTVSNQLILAGGNNVTLSQSTGAGGNTISISAGAGGGSTQTMNYYQNMDRGTSASLATAAGTLMLQRLNQENDLFAANLTANTILLNMTANMTATSLSSSHTVSASIGIYSNFSTHISLINSASTTWAVGAATSNTALYNGPRWLSFVSSQWSSAPNFVQDSDYVFGVIFRSSNYAPPLSYMGQNYMHSNQRSGSMGVSAATNASMAQGNYWNAMYTATTSALPAAISASQVNRNNATAIFMPHVILNNRYSGTF